MTVASIYIPHFEKTFDPNFIAMTLNKKGIAKVSRIAIEPYPKKHPLHHTFQRAYVDIKGWHDTESAYNFIKRLIKPNLETRFNHSDDNWWVVHINKFPHKTSYVTKKRYLTVYEFHDNDTDSETYVSDYHYDDIDDSTLTVSCIQDKDSEDFYQIDDHDFDDYTREIIDLHFDYAEFWADF